MAEEGVLLLIQRPERCVQESPYPFDSYLVWEQGDGEEEETDDLVNQVLDEIGVNLDSELVGAPGGKQAEPAAAAANRKAPEPMGESAGGGGNEDGDDDLQQRLNNLRKQ